MTNKKPVMLRLREDMLAAIKKQAEIQQRSVNNVIEVALTQYLSNIEKR